jgi:hypothetical protein
MATIGNPDTNNFGGGFKVEEKLRAEIRGHKKLNTTVVICP